MSVFEVSLTVLNAVMIMDVTEPAKIRSHRISCAKSIGFVARSELVPAIIANVVQLSYLKLNSYKQTSNEQLKSL